MIIANAIFLACVLAVAAVMVFRDLRYTLRKRSSANWPSAEARIESSTLGHPAISALPRFLYRVHFSYSYQVNGLEYSGRFSLLVGGKTPAESIREALTGKTTLVRYHAQNPSISLLADRRLMGKPVMQGPSWNYN